MCVYYVSTNITMKPGIFTDDVDFIVVLLKIERQRHGAPEPSHRLPEEAPGGVPPLPRV